MSDRRTYREILDTLEKDGMIDYGSVIPGDRMRELIGIKYPDVATKKEFDQLALAELAAVDYIRNVLINAGMYLTYDQGNYRILLPSENKEQVERYIGSATKKLSRAEKLSANTPSAAGLAKCDQTSARIRMKMDSIRSHHQPAA